MAEQVCPACACTIGADAYEKDDILYCCQPCAERQQCECGCCETVSVEEKLEASDSKHS